MFSCVGSQMRNSAAIAAAPGAAIPAAGNVVMEFDTKICCLSEDGIGLLVDHFYGKVRVDPVLGPIFERVLRDEWGPHTETMRDFWSSVMLTSGRYKGAPAPAHLRIKAIEPEMFDRWLRLFGETCDELFENEVAQAFRAKAIRIAESLKLALFFRPNLASTRKSS